MRRSLALLLFAIAAGACANSTSVVASSTVLPSGTPTPEARQPLPTVSNPDCCWFPTGPGTIGFSVPMAGTLAVGVTSVTRPANELLLREDPSNPPPSEGHEYIVVSVSVECIGPEQSQCAAPGNLQFRVLAADGKSYEELAASTTLPKPLRVPQQTPQTLVQGNIAFLIPIGDDNLVMEVNWPNMTGIYLSLR